MTEVDHKSVIAGLSAAERAELLGKSDAAGLLQLGSHLGALIVTSTLIVFGGWVRPVAMAVQGVLLVFLFTGLHETVHRTPFRTRWLNDLVGWFCGLVVFIAPTWFRAFHLEHHRYTNQSDRDPELATPRPTNRVRYLIYLSGIPDLFGRWRALIMNASRPNADRFVSAGSKRAVRIEAVVQLSLYGALGAVSVVAGSTFLIWLWLLPMLIGGPFLRAYLLAEHGACPEHESMFRNTRTVLTNPAVRWLAWNMPYHAEHHAFPAVPFHKLGAFHQHTKPHLVETSPSYTRFNRDYLAAARDR